MPPSSEDMKSPLTKLLELRSNRSETKKEIHCTQNIERLKGLTKASKDLLELKKCYDRMMSVSTSTAKNASEFAESLQELGACLLDKLGLNNDEDSGRALLKMSRAEYKVERYFRTYRSQIFQTMSRPSASILRELEILEEMKRECDYKSGVYKNKLAEFVDKGGCLSKELYEAQSQYELEADQFLFRLKSLKQGHFRGLLTQIVRHHAAQISLFRKGLVTLEKLEPHFKLMAEKQLIDYPFKELYDEISDAEYRDDVIDHDAELRFGHQDTKQDQDPVPISRNSLEETSDKGQAENIKESEALCRDFATSPKKRSTPKMSELPRSPIRSGKMEKPPHLLLGHSDPLFPRGGALPLPLSLRTPTGPLARTSSIPSGGLREEDAPADDLLDASAATTGNTSPIGSGKMEKPSHFLLGHSSPLTPRGGALPLPLSLPTPTGPLARTSSIPSGGLREEDAPADDLLDASAATTGNASPIGSGKMEKPPHLLLGHSAPLIPIGGALPLPLPLPLPAPTGPLARSSSIPSDGLREEAPADDLLDASAATTSNTSPIRSGKMEKPPHLLLGHSAPLIPIGGALPLPLPLPIPTGPYALSFSIPPVV